MNLKIQTPAGAALIVLIILQGLMLMSLFAGVKPHPPASVTPFGIGPFVSVSISIAVSALILGVTTSRVGIALSLGAVVLALISFGPQKYFDAQFALIWPAVIVGQVAVVIIVIQAISGYRGLTAP